MKATVFRVSGSVPANNFIMLPKSSTQSLGLTGSFFYLLFRPLPAKYFVIHLEVVTSTSLVVRISFSNLFKEFKSTSTWLQFPYRHGGAEADALGGKDGTSSVSSNKSAASWTFVALNLKEILSKYLSNTFSYLKNIKLCANILVKNVFTSDIEYSPVEPADVRFGGYFQPPPREMSLPLPREEEFLDMYDYVCFPCEEKTKHGGGREDSSVGPPGQSKLLRGMKPGMVLVSVSQEVDERRSRLTEKSSRQVVMKGMSNGRQAKRPGGSLKAKQYSGEYMGDKKVEYFVQREVDDFSGDVLTGRLRKINGRSVRGGSDGGSGVRQSVSWAEDQSSEGGVVEEDEGEVHVHMDQDTKVVLTQENSSRSGKKFITIKKTQIIVSLRVGGSLTRIHFSPTNSSLSSSSSPTLRLPFLLLFSTSIPPLVFPSPLSSPRLPFLSLPLTPVPLPPPLPLISLPPPLHNFPSSP